MCERKKKPTLEQLRTLYHFDIPTLATQAGVETKTVDDALRQKPIKQEDAEKILVALSEHTGLQLSFEKVDIAMWQDYSMLWIVRASDNECHLIDEFTFVYARNRKQAYDRTRVWRAEQSHLPYIEFTPYPEGITSGTTITIPGYIKVTLMERINEE